MILFQSGRVAVVLFLAIALTGCAATPNQGNPRDPFEGFNRAMFSFNDTLDKAALKPVAETYQRVLPVTVQIGVGNFFANLADVWTGANNLLQGKPKEAGQDVLRFVMNSTVGIAGLFDVATSSGIERHRDEDFGQTLGKWGIPSGPYLVLPLIGSTTVRDSVVMPLDMKGDLWRYKYPVRWRNFGSGLRLIDQRSLLLDASNLIEEAALDRYEFVRDAYLQRRQYKIDDGDLRKGMSFEENGQIKAVEGKGIMRIEQQVQPLVKAVVNFIRPGELPPSPVKSADKEADKKEDRPDASMK
jgi:phospholipid-binding lipoprotein MlaA